MKIYKQILSIQVISCPDYNYIFKIKVSIGIIVIYMNQFISPHQNININISYNLDQQKVPQIVFGKKLQKTIKTQSKQNNKQEGEIKFKGIKGNNKRQKFQSLEQSDTSKNNKQFLCYPYEYKNISKKKKKKTKFQKNSLITYTDFLNSVNQQSNNKRFKTEGGLNVNEVTNFTGKKQGKIHPKQSYTTHKSPAQHFKSAHCSLSQPYPKKIKYENIDRKTISNIQQKQKRRIKNKSCNQLKKQLVSNTDHICSMTTNIAHQNSSTNTNKKKQRSSSAHMIRGDKFVSKLLDMSVLASDLGNSLLVNDDKNSTEKNIFHSKQNKGSQKLSDTFREYMNSIDMRVVKKMQDDTKIQQQIQNSSYAKFTNKKLGIMASQFTWSQGLELITYLNKIRRISMNTLNNCATKIQKVWRKKTKQTMVSYYTTLFRNATMITNNSIDISKINRLQSDGSDLQVLNIRDSDMRQLYHFQDINMSQSSNSPYLNTQINKIEKFHRPSDQSQNNTNKILRLQNIQNYQNQYNQSQQQQQNQSQQDDLQCQQQQNNTQKYINNFMQVIIANNKQDKIKIPDKPKITNQQNSVIIKRKYGENLGNYFSKYTTTTKATNQNQGININTDNKNDKNNKLNPFQINQKQLKQYENDKYSQQYSSYQIQDNHNNNIEQSSHQKYEKQIQNIQQNIQLKLKLQNKGKQQQNQSIKWNQIHKILNKNAKGKVPTISKQILEQLMKQSVHNQQWVNYNSHQESQKVPRNEQSIKQIKYYIGDKNTEVKKQLAQQSLSQLSENNDNMVEDQWNGVQQVTISNNIKINEIQTKNNKNDNQQFDEDEQPPSFNWNKYSEIARLHKLQWESTYKKQAQNANNQQDQEPIMSTTKNLTQNNPQIHNQSQQSMESVDICSNDQQSKMQNNIVDRYLDCGLDYFGVKTREAVNDKNDQSQQSHYDEILFSNSDENQEGKINKEDSDERVYVFANGTDDKQSKQIEQKDQSSDAIRSPIQQSQLQLKEQKRMNSNFKKQKITELILVMLMEQLALDISGILKKIQGNSVNKNNSNPHFISQKHHQSDTSNKKNNRESILNTNNLSNNGVNMATNFQSIRIFITKLKAFIMSNSEYIEKVIANIKNNIGPTSLEILRYLRIDTSDDNITSDNIDENEDQQEWLFAIPNQLFEIFHKQLIDEHFNKFKKPLSKKIQLYTQFWHRGIFECFNQCLDFQRPYGIIGASYAWVVQPRLQRKITITKIKQILQSAEDRLLQISCSGGGIIFDKPDSPYRQLELEEQSKNQLNQDRVSRILATQIFDDENSWISYNDEVTDMMVQISKRLEQILIFQFCTQFKRITRKRRNWIQYSHQEPESINQQIIFQLQQLQ